MSARVIEFPDFPGDDGTLGDLRCYQCKRSIPIDGFVPATTLDGRTICRPCALESIETKAAPDVTILRLQATVRILQQQVDAAMAEVVAREAHWKSKCWCAFLVGCGLTAAMIGIVAGLVG